MNSVFRTVLNAEPASQKISHQTSVMLIGSCFTENIGQLFASYKFDTLINPFGIVYNPISIAHSLRFIVQNKRFEGNDIFNEQQKWHSWFHHGRFSHPQADVCLQQINNHISAAHQFLLQARFLFITFGTAWVYQTLDSQQIVANCHKVPQKHFRKYLLDVDDIVQQYTTLLAELKQFNPSLNIVFTISPVRHLHDGFVQNQQSKATLSLAIHKLQAHSNECDYFPAYEIIMDDLRDYRFYDTDMLHPNSIAIDYIWQQLINAYTDNATQNIMNEIAQINKTVAHRPFDTDNEQYKIFVTRQEQKINQFAQKYPYIDVSQWTKHFQET